MTRLLMVWLSLLAIGTPVPAQNFEIDITQFDSWIFSGMQNAEVARQRLESQAQMEIDRLDLGTRLKESQIQKLLFAAKGDIKHFFDDVDVAHRQFHAMKAAGEIDQANINEVYQLASPLAQRINQGIYGNDSLLKKVARGCVDGEQAKQLQEREQRQRKWESDAAIVFYLANLGRRVPMTYAQREKFQDWATSSITLRDPKNSYSSYVLMVKMSELPQAQLKSIFDDVQYAAIHKNFQSGIAMKANLKQMGLLDDE